MGHMVSVKTFAKQVGRGRGWACTLVKDMERMGYHVYKDGITRIFDERDAVEALDRRRLERESRGEKGSASLEEFMASH